MQPQPALTLRPGSVRCSASPVALARLQMSARAALPPLLPAWAEVSTTTLGTLSPMMSCGHRYVRRCCVSLVGVVVRCFELGKMLHACSSSLRKVLATGPAGCNANGVLSVRLPDEARQRRTHHQLNLTTLPLVTALRKTAPRCLAQHSSGPMYFRHRLLKRTTHTLTTRRLQVRSSAVARRLFAHGAILFGVAASIKLRCSLSPPTSRMRFRLRYPLVCKRVLEYRPPVLDCGTV